MIVSRPPDGSGFLEGISDMLKGGWIGYCSEDVVYLRSREDFLAAFLVKISHVGVCDTEDTLLALLDRYHVFGLVFVIARVKSSICASAVRSRLVKAKVLTCSFAHSACAPFLGNSRPHPQTCGLSERVAVGPSSYSGYRSKLPTSPSSRSGSFNCP